MTERDAEFFQILIRQLRKNVESNVVLGKTLDVPGHAKLLNQSASCCIADGDSVFGAAADGRIKICRQDRLLVTCR